MATVCLSEPRVYECPASLPTTEYVCFSGERMSDFGCLGILVGLWEGEATQAWVWIAMIMEVDGRCHGSTLLPRDLSVIQLHVVEYRIAKVQHSADNF
jgi:hypothetical protein